MESVYSAINVLNSTLQDEIISDEECEPEARSDVEDEINQERPAMAEIQQITQQPMPFFNSNPPPIQSNLPPMSHHHAQPQPLVMAPQPQSNPVPTVNGAIHPDDLNIMREYFSCTYYSSSGSSEHFLPL